MDFQSSLTRWQSTKAALTELTSCRTNLTLTLVLELQTLRNLSASSENGRDEYLSSVPIIMLTVSRCCTETDVDALGQSCDVDLTEFCERLQSDLSELLNVTQRDGLTDFTLAIEKILHLWGLKEKDIGFLKLNPDWTDVLALKQLVSLQELNSRLMTGEREIQDEIWHATTLVSVVKEMSENLQHCWTENMDTELNLTSSKDFVLLDGSVEFTLALENTLRCFHAWAGWALKLKSRDVSSTISLQVCLLAIACLIYPVVLLSFKQMTDWIQDYARSLREKTEDLKRERRLAENLLHQMLPKTVANQLRQNKHVEAESYEKVQK